MRKTRQNKRHLSAISTKLHLGCGTVIKPDYVNLDIKKLKGVDVIHNLNKFPYPFKDNTFEVVEMHHVLEHLDNPLKVLEELWRISKPNAVVVIAVPHWSHFTAYSDFTHKHYFSSSSFIYFEQSNPRYYSEKANFKVLQKRFTATRINFPWLNPILNPILNISPILTEMFLCKFLPVSQVIFKLRAIK